jgi:hypothetical protein
MMQETFLIWLTLLLTICLVVMIIVVIMMIVSLPKNPDDMILTISSFIIIIIAAGFVPMMWTSILEFNLNQTCLAVMTGMKEVCLD